MEYNETFIFDEDELYDLVFNDLYDGCCDLNEGDFEALVEKTIESDYPWRKAIFVYIG